MRVFALNAMGMSMSVRVRMIVPFAFLAAGHVVAPYYRVI